MNKTKIILNGKEILLEDSAQQLTLEFFDLLSKDLKELVINDDGGDEFKSKLKEFDISDDKTFGNDWHFAINEKSKPLLSEVLRTCTQKQWGHFRYSLIGKDFRIDFEDVSDEVVEPEYAKEGIISLFEIKSSGSNLGLIESLFETNVFKE